MQRGVLALGVLASSIAAAAPPRTAQLDVQGACELADLATRASELLGRMAIDPTARGHIVVISEQAADGVRATVGFVDENGVEQPARPIRAASCDELIESAALVISLVLRDEARVIGPPPPLPPPPSLPEPTPDAPTYLPLPPATHAPNLRSVELGAATSSARVSALVIGGRLERRRTALTADLQLAMPTGIDVLAGSVRVAIARADAGGCLRADRVSACGVLSVGGVHARGDDLMDARSAIGPLAAVGLRAEWRQRVARRVGLRVFASAEQLLVRPSILVGEAPVWTPPLLQAWLGIGLFFQVP